MVPNVRSPDREKRERPLKYHLYNKNLRVNIKSISLRNVINESNQIKSNQINSTQLNSTQLNSTQLNSTQIKSNQIKSNQIKSNQIKSNQIKSNQSVNEILLPISPDSVNHLTICGKWKLEV